MSAAEPSSTYAITTLKDKINDIHLAQLSGKSVQANKSPSSSLRKSTSVRQMIIAQDSKQNDLNQNNLNQEFLNEVLSHPKTKQLFAQVANASISPSPNG